MPTATEGISGVPYVEDWARKLRADHPFRHAREGIGRDIKTPKPEALWAGLRNDIGDSTTASTFILRVEYAISKFPNYGTSFRA